nr:glycosyltransferase [Desulfocapsaceae bacterium]
RVIHNGISPKEIHTKLRSNVFSIAAIGRLDRIKGFDILLEQLQELTFPYHLTIAGEGPEKRRLQQMFVDLNLDENVSMVGFYEKIPELMGRSHVIVLSSHSEGFPQVMVEALFYGNVFLSTPVGGVVEVLPELFLVNHESIAKKLKHVYENYDDYREQYNRLKNSISANFELSTVTSQYQALYKDIIEKSENDKGKRHRCPAKKMA